MDIHLNLMALEKGQRSTSRDLIYAERDEAYCIYVQRTEEEVFRVRIKASDTIGS